MRHHRNVNCLLPAVKRIVFHSILFIALLVNSSIAFAWDFCALYDDTDQQGASIWVPLSDDVELSVWGNKGKTGFSREWASGLDGNYPFFLKFLTASAESAYVRAYLSDIHLYLWGPRTIDIPDTSLDYGGDGEYYLGDVFGFRCPKGYWCIIDMAPQFANRNYSWQCMREFHVGNTYTLPLQQTRAIRNAIGDERAGISEEVERLFKDMIWAESDMDEITDTLAYVSIEPYWAYCKNTNRTCSDLDMNRYADTIRVHWEGVLNPDMDGDDDYCIAETVIECGVAAWWSFGIACVFVAIDPPICEAIADEKHVVIDTWLRPALNPNQSPDGPLKFEQHDTRVSVESGTGSDAFREAILEALDETDLTEIAAEAIYTAVGESTCDILPFAPLCVDGTPRADVGEFMLGGFGWPERFQAAWHISDKTDGPSWAYFPPHTVSEAKEPCNGDCFPMPQIVYINHTRDENR